MFSENGRRPQHSHPTHDSEANVNQSSSFGRPVRHMGPPQLNYPPQPVEIDPVSYPRTSVSFTHWEPIPYSIGSIGEPSPSPSSSIGHNRAAPISLDLGTRNNPQDPLTIWYTGNDGPWIPKGAVPEVAPDDRLLKRGHSLHRISGYGSQSGLRHRPGNPSDNGSVHFGVSPSDSGYGTGLSLESVSVRGSDVADHSQENRSLIGRIPEFRQYNENGSSRDPNGTEQWGYSSPSAPSYRCETCQKTVKTRSELKKHHFRHTKPFTCPKPSCSRKEGFSTVNDLDRHTKSKHPGEMQSKTYRCLVAGCKSQDKIWPRLDNFRSHLKRMHHLQDGSIDDYVNRGGTDQTKCNPSSQGTSSESPRRLDQDASIGLGPEDFPDLAYRDGHPQWNHVSPTSLDQHTEIADPLLENADGQTLVPPNEDCPIGLGDKPGKPTGFEGSTTLWRQDSRNGCLKEDKRLGSSDSIGEGMAVPTTDSLGSPLGELESTDILESGKKPKLKKSLPIDPCLREALTAVLSAANFGRSTSSDPGTKSLPGAGLSDMGHASGQHPPQVDSGMVLPSPAVTSSGLPDNQDLCLDTSADSLIDKKELTDQDASLQRLLQAIRDAGYILKRDNKAAAGFGQTVSNLGSSSNKKRDVVACSKCKFYGRPCELKKHMKRHTRPYGCTYTKCTKTFGSKNDWKRHETSQHYQHQTWRCDEKTNGASCTKVFFSADIARAHFTRVHKATDPKVLEGKIRAREIHANNQVNFWCGFCEEIVSLNQKGIDGWTERFNHIDDHFMGRNGRDKQQIAQWKAAENINTSAKPRSLDEADGESSGDSSPLSSDTSPASQDVPAEPTKAEANPRKRGRATSDDMGNKPKQSKHGKISEYRIECCQCYFQLNPRTETVCPIDSHSICEQCTKTQFTIPTDNAI